MFTSTGIAELPVALFPTMTLAFPTPPQQYTLSFEATAQDCMFPVLMDFTVSAPRAPELETRVGTLTSPPLAPLPTAPN